MKYICKIFCLGRFGSCGRTVISVYLKFSYTDQHFSIHSVIHLCQLIHSNSVHLIVIVVIFVQQIKFPCILFDRNIQRTNQKQTQISKVLESNVYRAQMIDILFYLIMEIQYDIFNGKTLLTDSVFTETNSKASCISDPLINDIILRLK